MNAWELIKSELAKTLTAESFYNWFLDTHLEAEQHNQLWVSVPSQEAESYIRQVYSDLLSEVIRRLGLPVQQVHFRTGTYSPAMTVAQSQPVSPTTGGTPRVQLNPRFTFESFVVGPCNQLAHAAAMAVATYPAQRYNPLFIYAGVGLGKTHLMQAIAYALLERYPQMRVVYASGEGFMNEMIRCIRNQRMSYFHSVFRQADALLVDDVHVVAGKEATQEEFFHTFNELYEHRKQIIISSDSPPREIPGLVDRLRSRFEWGLMADIQPPDLETKMAILDRKAEAEGVTLPKEVRIFIATRAYSNVRELEGALIRLAASSSLTGVPITLELAQQVLKSLLPNNERRITIEGTIKAVASRFNLQPADLKRKTNARQITWPRQIAMYLAKELTPASLPEIGRAFGGKHHTTVLHSIQKIEREREKNPDLNRLIQSLTDSLR